MTHKIFLSTTSSGIGRAEGTVGGDWAVEIALSGQNVRCLAADPLDRAVVYAGTKGQGVWRSGDAGKSWEPAGLDGQMVNALAVSPHEPGVIYAGTKPALMYVSRDSGGSWSELEGFRRIPFRWWWFSPADPPGMRAYVQAIAVSPTDPNVLLAGIELGAVVLSEDGGQTWSGHRKRSLRDCHALKFHAADGRWVYEAGGTGGGASVSRDGGRTWHKVTDGLAKGYGVSCAADGERPEIWYVAVAPGPGKAYGEKAQAYLYRAEGGAPWQPIGWEPHPMERMPIDLLTDPGQPGHLYAGLVNGDVWHSANYGDEWQQLPFNLRGIWRTFLMIDR